MRDEDLDVAVTGRLDAGAPIVRTWWRGWAECPVVCCKPAARATETLKVTTDMSSMRSLSKSCRDYWIGMALTAAPVDCSTLKQYSGPARIRHSDSRLAGQFATISYISFILLLILRHG